MQALFGRRFITPEMGAILMALDHWIRSVHLKGSIPHVSMASNEFAKSDDMSNVWYSIMDLGMEKCLRSNDTEPKTEALQRNSPLPHFQSLASQYPGGTSCGLFS
jgi:hypothetical protein